MATRRPIEQEVRGLMSPRERVWTAIRRLKAGFTLADVQDKCDPMVQAGTVEKYMVQLRKTGFIKQVGTARPKVESTHPTLAKAIVYDLASEQFEAPRVSGGKVLPPAGLGHLAMWRCMKVLKEFDYRELARAASVGDLVVKERAAQTYVNALATAGYLVVIRKGGPQRIGRHRLVKDTGPRAPVLTRRKCIFDLNDGTSTNLETAQEVCDGLE